MCEAVKKRQKIEESEKMLGSEAERKTIDL